MTLIALQTPLESDVVDMDLPCHLVDPELFFSDQPIVIEAAKRLCLACPLRSACLAGAIERAEPHGVWGGELFESGAVIARKRPRGRPRKVAAPVEPAPAIALAPSPFRVVLDRESA